MADLDPGPAALDLEVSADLEGIGQVLAAIERLGAAGELGAAVLFALRLAADEILTNIMHYSQCGSGAKVHVRLQLGDGRARLEIADHGRPFDPLLAPPPDTSASLTERPIGGLGIHLVRQLMDEVSYRRSQDHNVLVMTKQMEP